MVSLYQRDFQRFWQCHWIPWKIHPQNCNIQPSYSISDRNANLFLRQRKKARRTKTEDHAFKRRIHTPFSYACTSCQISKISLLWFLNNRMKKNNLQLIFMIQGHQRFKARYTGMSTAELIKEIWDININICPACGCCHMINLDRIYVLPNFYIFTK